MIFVLLKSNQMTEGTEECVEVFPSFFLADNFEAALEINVSNMNSSIYIVNYTVKVLCYLSVIINNKH